MASLNKTTRKPLPTTAIVGALAVGLFIAFPTQQTAPANDVEVGNGGLSASHLVPGQKGCQIVSPEGSRIDLSVQSDAKSIVLKAGTLISGECFKSGGA